MMKINAEGDWQQCFRKQALKDFNEANVSVQTKLKDDRNNKQESGVLFEDVALH